VHEPIPNPIVVMTFRHMEEFVMVDVLLGDDLQVQAEFVYDDPAPVPMVGNPHAMVLPTSTIKSITTTATAKRWVSFITSGPADERVAKLMAGDIKGFWKLMGMAGS
jgi:hypothetical protein